MINIIFITPSLRTGGAEKNIINTINILDQNKFNITLIICGGENNYIQLLPKGIDIRYLFKPSVSKSYLQILKILLSIKPDIVFTSAAHVTIPIQIIKSFLIKQFIHIARVPTLPSNNLGSSLSSKIFSKYSKSIYKKINYVIAQTDEMKKELEDIWNISSNKLITVPNLVNIQQIKKLSNGEFDFFDKNKFNIVSMGTLYSIKGFDLLIQAIALIKKQHPNIMLYIIGNEGIEKGYKLKLEIIVQYLNLKEHVSFLGFKSNPYPYLKHADIFVLSSRKEGFPNVVLESLAVGTPVVVTNCINFSDIIKNGENGYIVKKNNIDSLAQGIISGKNLEKTDFTYNNFNFNNWFKKIYIDENTPDHK